MSERWRGIARRQAGADYARAYARRFRHLAARGGDVHGEAGFVARLRPAPARVLDAGCGTGRTGIRLAELGYDVLGCDVDETMLAVAVEDAPHLAWRVADLAALETTDLGPAYDVVLLAGNVVPLLDPGTLEAAARGLAHHLAPDGVLVAGFGLDAAHLPGDCPPTPLADVDAAFAGVGLARQGTWPGWDEEPGGPLAVAPEGYVVVAYARPGTSLSG